MGSRNRNNSTPVAKKPLPVSCTLLNRTLSLYPRPKRRLKEVDQGLSCSMMLVGCANAAETPNAKTNPDLIGIIKPKERMNAGAMKIKNQAILSHRLANY